MIKRLSPQLFQIFPFLLICNQAVSIVKYFRYHPSHITINNHFLQFLYDKWVTNVKPLVLYKVHGKYSNTGCFYNYYLHFYHYFLRVGGL